jgi:hypothetical protein
VAGDHDGEGDVSGFVVRALVALAFALAALVATLLGLLRPAPGEWSAPWDVGPWRIELSVPATLRMATHPMVLRLLEGRRWQTPMGAIDWRAGDAPHTWHAACAPCRLTLPALGDEPVQLSRVELRLQRIGQSAWRGDFALGEPSRAVRGRWQARFDPRGAEVDLQLPDTPLADAYALFADTIPEVKRARIAGHVAMDARLRWPQRELAVQPRLRGFFVSGLGTEALLDATPSCPAPSRGFGTWLPRAVLAAEDQRFHEHAGYDLPAMVDAWSQNTQAGTATHGGSTLTQQLAKLLYTGDDRHHLRKLRELLYAVELDRVLGKARVLHLYLSIAPWGDGRCGAASAARHHLRKPVDTLTPIEAAWLASLLHGPDREAARWVQDGQVDVERVGWVIAHLRPMNAERRAALIERLAGWTPPPR